MRKLSYAAILVLIALLLTACSDSPEGIQEGIIEDLDYVPNYVHVAAVQKPAWFAHIDGKRYAVTESAYNQLDIGMQVRYEVVMQDIINLISYREQ